MSVYNSGLGWSATKSSGKTTNPLETSWVCQAFVVNQTKKTAFQEREPLSWTDTIELKNNQKVIWSQQWTDDNVLQNLIMSQLPRDKNPDFAYSR